MDVKLSPFSHDAIVSANSLFRGHEGLMNGGQNRCYITGTSADRIVLYIHDIKGWTNTNARRLADLYAEQVDATVYIPDFFANEVPPQTLPELLKYDLRGFMSRHGKDTRRPEIHACAKELRQRHPGAKLGVVGYCFGGWSGLDLASRLHDSPDGSGQKGPLIDCLCIAHPASVTKEELRNVGTPTLIIAPEHDNPFNPDLKRFANETIPTLGVPYCYSFFPRVEHRFASQPDIDSVEGGEEVKTLWKHSFERAQMQIVNWLNMYM